MDTAFANSESGLIVNNSTFTTPANTNVRGFIRYRDVLGNSEANIDLAMNEFLTANDGVDAEIANPDIGVINIEHISLDTENNDNLVFNSIDNRMVLQENGSVAFRITDSGDGTAFIAIGDTPDDALTEGLDPQADAIRVDPVTGNLILNPDIEIADTFDAAFVFNLETEATVDISDLEIHMTEDADGGGAGNVEDQTVFLFENISGTTSINISGNTILFEDANAFVNPGNGALGLNNNMQVTQFDAVSGDVTLSSTLNNQVGVNVGGNIFLLTNPALLFQAPNSANFIGQFQFNNIFVP